MTWLLRYRHALLGTRRSLTENCWCEYGVGNPMLHDHTDACKEAFEALLSVERQIRKDGEQVGNVKMGELGRVIQDTIPGLGFAVFVFEFHSSGMINYISNAERKDMIQALKETYERFEKNQDFKTPEEN